MATRHRQGAAASASAAVGALALALLGGLAACAPSAPGGQAQPPSTGSARAHSSATPSGKTPAAADASTVGSAFHLSPPRGRGHLAPGSDPSALPGDVLIADEDNHRLLLVDPFGRIRWQYPSPGTARQARRFGSPDDAFISPDGATIVATEEMDNAVSVINIAEKRVTRRYGKLYVPGSAAG